LCGEFPYSATCNLEQYERIGICIRGLWLTAHNSSLASPMPCSRVDAAWPIWQIASAPISHYKQTSPPVSNYHAPSTTKLVRVCSSPCTTTRVLVADWCTLSLRGGEGFE
jgi:hypothetical protein